MAHDPKALQAICESATPPDAALRFRRMFSGIMGYAEDKPFVYVSARGLVLKLSEPDREALLAIPGATPFLPMPGRPPSKTYVVVPDAMLADLEALRAWMARSIAGLAAAPDRNRRRPLKRR